MPHFWKHPVRQALKRKRPKGEIFHLQQPIRIFYLKQEPPSGSIYGVHLKVVKHASRPRFPSSAWSANYAALTRDSEQLNYIRIERPPRLFISPPLCLGRAYDSIFTIKRRDERVSPPRSLCSWWSSNKREWKLEGALLPIPVSIINVAAHARLLRNNNQTNWFRATCGDEWYPSA